MKSYLAMLMGGTLLLFSCQESSHKDESNAADSVRNATDTVHSGLEGTREQAAQVGGGDVKLDTSAGQTGGTGGLPGSSDSSDTRQFLSDAVAGNYAEVRLAKLALKNSGNNEIKAVSRMLEKDHATALTQLKALASKKHVTIPAEETADVKDKISKMSGKKGSEFDKIWCDELMEKHKTTISKYEDMAKKTTDQDLKNWINNILPKIRIHHDKLMECHNKIG